jgi:hypothetical protein
MSDGAFFKVKSSKRSNPEARTTLDAIHNQKVQNMLEERTNLHRYQTELAELKRKTAEATSDMEIWRLERETEQLEKTIKSIEDGSEIMDYYLRTGDILYHYYDIQDQIQQGTATFVSNKAKPGSILAILEEVAQDEKDGSSKHFELSASGSGAGTFGSSTVNPTEEPIESDKKTQTKPSEKKSFQRNQLLNDYLQIEDPAMGRNTVEEYDDPWTNCKNCGNEMTMCLNEANLTCSQCGHQEFILVDSDKPSYKDPPREVCYYAYKKINHFNEWLAQFQAKESTEIPADVYDEILVQLKKERITNMNTLKPTKLREILRKMK